MSTELFTQLEQKVGQAIDSIEMLKMEVEELKEENQRLTEAKTGQGEELEQLRQTNTQLQEERDQWAQRLEALVARFSETESETQSA
ncbi:MAG: septal ring assembly protein ZapB [Cobetia sp.]|jgi:cell division protein ZapB|uniref:cell division protein ZapB n=1 Tax=Cobetia TaxID=204286 RepID=UPI000C680B87|nr:MULTISPECIES: cell division protein ZapB [Cobetia]MBF09052.1 septal ring assembly protein ZapB [Cobetia sp.]MBK10255.1 septal ring assembly protein ZapB [Cobetia sp.]UBU48438.1 cell division protein ZapB [Cobetia amphilecti]HAR06946.1 septal ring assembly protein ZapB [Cobetia sp.]|tara:strand:- start:690 stop:950 length:261 start_codon:yes stop_codon:yes gene_type:complete